VSLSTTFSSHPPIKVVDAWTTRLIFFFEIYFDSLLTSSGHSLSLRSSSFCLDLDATTTSIDVNPTALRIVAIFVILIASLAGAMFPIVSMRVEALNVHQYIYMFMRYFGSGVVIATGFIHLLAPGFGYLGNPCLRAM
jgi:hypothetical protein